MSENKHGLIISTKKTRALQHQHSTVLKDPESSRIYASGEFYETQVVLTAETSTKINLTSCPCECNVIALFGFLYSERNGSHVRLFFYVKEVIRMHAREIIVSSALAPGPNHDVVMGQLSLDAKRPPAR